MYQSAVRTTELVDNMLHFTRGRLGGGMGLNRIPDAPLRETLDHVIGELKTAWPDRVVQAHFALMEPVDCDPDRIDQLCSNLLSNAPTHGAQAQPIRVEATSSGGVFELSVANGGAPIPDEAVPHLFKPFSRGKINQTSRASASDCTSQPRSRERIMGRCPSPPTPARPGSPSGCPSKQAPRGGNEIPDPASQRFYGEGLGQHVRAWVKVPVA